MVICDTSGRLHTNAGLMEELAKSKRAIGKRLPGAPHEVLLVLDGTTGGQTPLETLRKPYVHVAHPGQSPPAALIMHPQYTRLAEAAC